MSFQPFCSNQQRPTLRSFRWCCTPSLNGLTFSALVKALVLDNVAAVVTLVRGRSSNPDLAKLGHLIHLAFFAFRAQGYWEYVQSKSNWADDISRLGFDDPRWRCHRSFFPCAFRCAHSHL